MTTILRNLISDLRFALRQMRHAPGFSLSVVLVLALGIGANAAMFTVLEGTLFRPLAYHRPGELVTITAVNLMDTPTVPRLADLQVWQQRSHLLTRFAYYDSSPAYLLAQNAEQKITFVSISQNLFSTLGTAPALGRAFTADEQQPGKGQVAILSDAVWRSQFHADPNILGQLIRVDDQPLTVIGVMPRGFLFPANATPAAQIWVPVELKPVTLSRGLDTTGFNIIARRQPGAALPAIDTELNSIQHQLIPLYTGQFSGFFTPAHLRSLDYRSTLTAKNQRSALLALLGSVAALWLIACANVACLMLARTAARRREMAVRSALGASRWRLIRQTLAESLLLSLTGGAAGLALAVFGLRLFAHSLITQLNPDISLVPDLRVLLALLVLSLLSAILFAFVPARLAASVNVEQTLRQDAAQSGTGRRQHSLQRILVVSELALTLALLVSCGLLLRTVFALHQVPLGFRTDHVFVIDPKLPGYKYDKLDRNTLVYQPLLARLKALPGIESAAITTIAPLEKTFNMSISIAFDSEDKAKGNSKPINATMRAAGPELQQVLGFTMHSGRYFNAQDTAASQPVAVVNRAFSDLYIASTAKGTMEGFQLGDKDRSFKVIGVIDDLHQMGVADPAMPEIDLNAAQMRPSDGFYQPTLKAHAEIILRSSRDPASLIPEINHVMQQLNPDLSATEVRSMNQIVEDSLGSQILAAHLLETLGGLALLVALAGLYSLLAYLVTLRTRELGLRLALGAQRSDILTLVLRGAGGLLITGTAIGIAISLVATRLLHSFLFGVKQNDALTLVTASCLLLAVGTVAAFLPARRAARLEPMQAIRTE